MLNPVKSENAFPTRPQGSVWGMKKDRRAPSNKKIIQDSPTGKQKRWSSVFPRVIVHLSASIRQIKWPVEGKITFEDLSKDASHSFRPVHLPPVKMFFWIE